MSDQHTPPRPTTRRPTARALERHRAAIESLDGRILGLVAKRLDEAHAIGQLKRARGIPLRDFEVEAQVCERLEATASALGRGRELGRDLALFLIERSLETQAPILESSYAGDRLKALVIGGMGGMGRWMAGFLEGQGHEVQILDPADGASRWPRAQSVSAGAAWADIVVVSAPWSRKCAA
jgi:chorismate mutase/prephenate dehydrogenase